MRPFPGALLVPSASLTLSIIASHPDTTGPALITIDQNGQSPPVAAPQRTTVYKFADLKTLHSNPGAARRTASSVGQVTASENTQQPTRGSQAKFTVTAVTAVKSTAGRETQSFSKETGPGPGSERRPRERAVVIRGRWLGRRRSVSLLSTALRLWPHPAARVGMTGFEPATSASRTQRSARLSYIPRQTAPDSSTPPARVNVGRRQRIHNHHDNMAVPGTRNSKFERQNHLGMDGTRPGGRHNCQG